VSVCWGWGLAPLSSWSCTSYTQPWTFCAIASAALSGVGQFLLDWWRGHECECQWSTVEAFTSGNGGIGGAATMVKPRFSMNWRRIEIVLERNFGAMRAFQNGFGSCGTFYIARYLNITS